MNRSHLLWFPSWRVPVAAVIVAGSAAFITGLAGCDRDTADDVGDAFEDAADDAADAIDDAGDAVDDAIDDARRGR